MAKNNPYSVPAAPPQLQKVPDFNELGPNLQALPARQRLFCWYYAHNGGDGSAAYKLAYPDMTSDLGARVNASKLLVKKQIREALREVTVFQFNALTIPAISALLPIIQNPSHKQHAKILEFVLNRVGFHETQMVSVKHEHTHKLDTAEIDAKLLRLAEVMGVSFKPSYLTPPLDAIPAPNIQPEAIDATFEEITPDAEPTPQADRETFEW